MKRILFNATHAEELRLAIVDGQQLLDLDIESSSYQQKKGNIYKGRVTRVEPSLEAAFVDYGMERQGFLPLKEISRIYFKGLEEGTPMSQVRIKDVIHEGQEFIVQVEKEERGTKGAALTTFISLAGRYLVLMPNNPKGGGISRRIEGEERADLREALADLEISGNHAIIARTAGLGKSTEELQWDLDFLSHLWGAITEAGEKQEAPFLIHQESNLVVRTIRDYLRPDIGEIVIDNPDVHERMKKFMEQVAPHNLHKLKLFNDQVPLFLRFQIEQQIESAFSRNVVLPSGGSVVFDRTEAMICIDVNSARATKGADIEETALNTNLEAADEIALQLRLRDLGGLLVIDFIDMTPIKSQRAVEQRLNEALKHDRARVQVGRISRFGMLEMSRQRLRPSLGEALSLACPRCIGTGHIRSVQSSALHILRVIQDEAMKENTAALHIHLPVNTATYLLNEKRHELNTIESRLATPVVVIPTAEMETPHYHIRRLKDEDLDSEEEAPSYEIPISDEDEEKEPITGLSKPKSEKPAVGQLIPAEAAPHKPKKSGEGLLVRLFKALFGAGEKKKSKPARRKRPGEQRGRRRDQRARSSSSQTRRAGQGQRPAPRKKSTQTQEAKSEKQKKSDASDSSRAGRGRGRRGRGGRRPQSRHQENEKRAANTNKANDTSKQGPETETSTDKSSVVKPAVKPASKPDDAKAVSSVPVIADEKDYNASQSPKADETGVIEKKIADASSPDPLPKSDISATPVLTQVETQHEPAPPAKDTPGEQ